MATTPYATRADLERTLSKKVVDQIFDDDSSGEGDEDPIDQLMVEATSRVNMYLAELYRIPVADSAGNVPDAVRFLTIDVAAALAEMRHPEYVRSNGEKRLADAVDILEKLRDGKIQLDSELLPPAHNAVAYARSGDANNPESKPKVFIDGMGDF